MAGSSAAFPEGKRQGKQQQQGNADRRDKIGGEDVNELNQICVLAGLSATGAKRWTRHPQFVYTFQIDTSHIKMPPHWRRDTTIDADEISSPRVLGIKEKIRIATPPKVVKFATDTNDIMQQMLDSQAPLARNLDPTKFGAAIALAVTTAMTASTSTIGTEVSTGISDAVPHFPLQSLSTAWYSEKCLMGLRMSQDSECPKDSESPSDSLTSGLST
jgi:hypothetical protein